MNNQPKYTPITSLEDLESDDLYVWKNYDFEKIREVEKLDSGYRFHLKVGSKTAVFSDFTLPTNSVIMSQMINKPVSVPIPIKEAAEKDPEVKQFLDDIKTGKITPIAPFDGMDIPWTNEEIQRLDCVIEGIITMKEYPEIETP